MPVELQGLGPCVDGGTVNNAPVKEAIAPGEIDRIVVVTPHPLVTKGPHKPEGGLTLVGRSADKRLIAIKPERGTLLDSKSFSLLDYSTGGDDPGPNLPREIEIDALLAGAGAIGNGVLFLLANLSVTGKLQVIDNQEYPKRGTVREFWFVDFVFEHPDGRHERVRKVSPVHTRRRAEQYERELRQALLDGSRKQRREAPRFAVFVQEYLQTYAEPNNKYSTVTAKKSAFKHHLVPAFGRHKLDEIRLSDIEGYKAKKLADGLSPKSVNNHLTILRKVLSVAVDFELLSFVPKVRWLKGPLPEFDFLDFDECERFLAAAEVEWRPMFTLAVRTGLRIGELRALQWDDVDLVAGRLVVRRNVWRGHPGTPKSGRNREIPLSDDALKALKSQRHLRGELVFCAEGGRQLEENECKHPIWRACKRAGLRQISCHVLRHTFASHLVMRGVPLKAVQELMGHATIEMTMRYAHLSPDVWRSAVQLLDRRGNTMATRVVPGAKVSELQ